LESVLQSSIFLSSNLTGPDLTKLLTPSAIAVIGASDDPKRIGGQPIYGLKNYGYKGIIIPVNSNRSTVQGLIAYSDIRSVTQSCDVALIALPADQVAEAVIHCGEANIPFAVVLSAGFAELGRPDLQKQLLDAVHASGVRVVGPNCTGLLNLNENIFSGFGAGFRNPNLKRGSVAMITQSGGFGYSVIAYAEQEGIGFSHMLATGNEVDITSLDMMEHLLRLDDVDVIVCYMEGIRDGRRLRHIGQLALQHGKPIVIWKVGNTDKGRKAALSHTANLTSAYAIYKAAFEEGGFIEIEDTGDLVDVVRAFQCRRLPLGKRVGILTTSGGAGVLLTDRCEQSGLIVPELSTTTTKKLKELGGGFATVENPVDLSAKLASDPDAFNHATRILLDDPNIDIVIIRSFPGTASDIWAKGLVRLLAECPKPVFINISGLASQSPLAIQVLEDNHIPCYPTPGRVVRGVAAIAKFSIQMKLYKNSIGDNELPPLLLLNLDLPNNSQVLSEKLSKAILQHYEIPVVSEYAVSTNEIHELHSIPFAFPVVVKVDSKDIPHKTEAGGVHLGLSTLDDVRNAALDVIANAQFYDFTARIEGVLIQQSATGIELIIGGVNDPTFGPYVVIGFGGIYTEIINDTVMRFAPFNKATAIEMIGELKASRLFHGYRRQPKYALDRLATALCRVSQLLSENSDRIAEIDINPLFLQPTGEIMAADCLIRLM